MPHPSGFELDANGIVITKPVRGWTLAPAAEIAVILAIQYLDNPKQLETGGYEQIQLILTPQQCLLLAGALTKHANRILDPDPGATKQ